MHVMIVVCRVKCLFYLLFFSFVFSHGYSKRSAVHQCRWRRPEQNTLHSLGVFVQARLRSWLPRGPSGVWQLANPNSHVRVRNRHLALDFLWINVNRMTVIRCETFLLNKQTILYERERESSYYAKSVYRIRSSRDRTSSTLSGSSKSTKNGLLCGTKRNRQR